MKFPPLLHDLAHQPSHLIQNILQNGGVLGSGQFTKVTQLLASLIVEHVENTLDGRDGKVVV
jgi:hypothetical protein